MSNLVDLWAETNPTLASDDTTPSFTLSNATVGPSLKLVRLGAGAASVGVIQIQASGASVPIIDLLANSFVSAVSIVFAASANWAGMGGVRVRLPDGITYGWIPIIPSGSFTAAAI